MEKEIIKLQETVAHLGIEIAELGDEVYSQHKEISALKQYIKIVEAKFQAAMDTESNINQPQDDAPPPHY
ncbi:MAG: SlyX family protein [Rhizobiales bacterium]|nr:SlyX family protein [Hyphomicrobiales bacterium]NRB14885.1 SlyX family protein [Hyphomicrobiales bacterium]